MYEIRAHLRKGVLRPHHYHYYLIKANKRNLMSCFVQIQTVHNQSLVISMWVEICDTQTL